MTKVAQQGKGKIRLIARNSLYRDSASYRRWQELDKQLNGPDPFAIPSSDRIAAINEFTSLTSRVMAERGNYFVEFAVSPDVSESGGVSYAEISDIRAASSVLWYQGTPSRNFNINAKFISRTPEEAFKASFYVHCLKSWRMPETIKSTIGFSTTLGNSGIGGGTPTTLYLQGYGDMYKNIPVVLTDLNIELSSEHDFIKKNDNIMMPIVTTVTISLKEAHSLEGNVDGFEEFDIVKYRNGTLQGW